MLWLCGLWDGQVFIMFREDGWIIFTFFSLFPRSSTIKAFKPPVPSISKHLLNI